MADLTSVNYVSDPTAANITAPTINVSTAPNAAQAAPQSPRFANTNASAGGVNVAQGLNSVGAPRAPSDPSAYSDVNQRAPGPAQQSYQPPQLSQGPPTGYTRPGPPTSESLSAPPRASNPPPPLTNNVQPPPSKLQPANSNAPLISALPINYNPPPLNQSMPPLAQQDFNAPPTPTLGGFGAGFQPQQGSSCLRNVSV